MTIPDWLAPIVAEDLDRRFDSLRKEAEGLRDGTDVRLGQADKPLREAAKEYAERALMSLKVARAQRSRGDWDWAIGNALDAMRRLDLAIIYGGISPDAMLGSKVRNANPHRLSEEQKRERAGRWNDLASRLRENRPQLRSKSAVTELMLRLAANDPEIREALSQPDGTLYSADMIRKALK